VQNLKNHFNKWHPELIAQMPRDYDECFQQAELEELVVAKLHDLYESSKQALAGKRRSSATLSDFFAPAKRMRLPSIATAELRSKLVCELKELMLTIHLGSALQSGQIPSFVVFCTALNSEYETLQRTRARSLLSLLYALVMDSMLLEFDCKSFSVTFDLWSSRSIVHSLLSITYHFVDDCFNLRSLVLDAVPANCKHTADNFAILLAKRIDLRAPTDALLYTGVSDNASNVIAASRLLLARFEELRNANLDERLAPGDMDESEPERALQCVPHTLNLAVQDMMNGAEAGVGQLVERVRAIVRAYRRSLSKKRLLSAKVKELQRHGRSIPDIRLKIDVSTRWNSTLEMLRSFVATYDAVLLMVVDDEFGRTEETIDPPRRELEYPRLQEIIRLLETMEEATVWMQGESYYTLPHVQAVLKTTTESVGNFVTDNIHVSAAKDALLRSLKARSEPYFEPRHPCTIAAALHPVHCHEPRDWVQVHKVLTEWMIHFMGDPALLARAPDDEELAVALGDEGGSFIPESDRDAKALARGLLVTIRREAKKLSDEERSFLFGSPREMTASAKAFYVGIAKSLNVVQLAALKTALSGIGAATSSERMFSDAGRIDAPLRNKLGEDSLEMLTIIRNFLKGKSKEDLDVFWAHVSLRLEDASFVEDLQGIFTCLKA